MKIQCYLAAFLCFALFEANSQMQIGYHYKIKKSTSIVYTYSDTTRDKDYKITAIDIHYYVPNATESTIVDKSNAAYVVTTHIHKGLILCDDLSAAITQKDGDASGRLYIDFWGIIKESSGCKDEKYINQSRKLGQFYYQINQKQTLADITEYKVFNYATTEIGLVTVPFKFRFGYTKDTVHVPNDASSNASIAVYIGRKWGSTRFYSDKSKTTNGLAFTAAAFAGPSVITISSENGFPTTDSVIKKQLKTKSNELGVTTGIAGTFAIRSFSIGVFLGIDMPLTGNSNLWYYKNKPWIGLGFGYKISMLGEK